MIGNKSVGVTFKHEHFTEQTYLNLAFEQVLILANLKHSYQLRLLVDQGLWLCFKSKPNLLTDLT